MGKNPVFLIVLIENEASEMKETSKLYVCTYVCWKFENKMAGVTNSERRNFWRDEVTYLYESQSEFPFPKQKQVRLRGSL